MSLEIRWDPKPAETPLIKAREWKKISVTTSATPGTATKIDPDGHLRACKVLMKADANNSSTAGQEISWGPTSDADFDTLSPDDQYNLSENGLSFSLADIYIKSAAASQTLHLLYLES